MAELISKLPLHARLAAIVGVVAAVLFGGAARAADVSVRAAKHNRQVVVDIEVTAHAPADVVWSVMTDYEQMPRYLSAVRSSVVTKRDGERLEVAQTIETQIAFMTFKASSVRAIELKPMLEVHSTLVSGDFEQFESTTRFVDRGTAVAIVTHSEYTPKAWLPPLIGPSVIESATRKQYEQMLVEIARRVALRAAGAASAAR